MHSNKASPMKLFFGMLCVVGIVFGVAVKFGFSTAETLGILGFALGLLSFWRHHVEKEIERRAEDDEKRERVTVDSSYNPDENDVNMRVFNPSHSRLLPLESVKLLSYDGNQQVTRWFRSTDGDETVDLEPRYSVVFTFPYDLPAIESILELPVEKVHVEICSHAGEIERISGDKITPILRQISDRIRNQPGVTVAPPRPTKL